MTYKKIVKGTRICVELGHRETVVYANKEAYRTLIGIFNTLSKSKSKDLYHLHLNSDLNQSVVTRKAGKKAVTAYSRITKKLLSGRDYEMIFYLSDNKEINDILASYKKKKQRRRSDAR